MKSCRKVVVHCEEESPQLQVAQSRSYVHTLGPSIGIICILGALGNVLDLLIECNFEGGAAHGNQGTQSDRIATSLIACTTNDVRGLLNAGPLLPVAIRMGPLFRKPK